MYPFQLRPAESLRQQLLVNEVTLAAASDHADVSGSGFQGQLQHRLVMEVPPGQDHYVAVPIYFQTFK
jgi:hypothetical protein